MLHSLTLPCVVMATSISVVPCSFKRLAIGGYGGRMCARAMERSGSLAAAGTIGARTIGGGSLCFGTVVTGGGAGFLTVNSGMMATGGSGFTEWVAAGVAPWGFPAERQLQLG